jgi:phosphoglucomutase
MNALTRAQAAKRLSSPAAAALADCRDRILSWLDAPAIHDDERREILELVASENTAATSELRDRFYRELEFGTGGLRGLTGAGNNRMNPHVVRRATQGLANYILKAGGEPAARRGVAIAYDSRLRSGEFALDAARVLAANGIRSYVFDSVQTTPCLSFAVRKLGCISGLCFTASHNPPQYHGLKVYWEDGAQIIPPQDSGILLEVFKLSGWDSARLLSEEDARARGLLNPVPPTVVDAYFHALDGLRIHDASTATRDVRIAYTPLHGTGAEPTRRALARWGFNDLHIVPEQEAPDGRFPTVKKPNPEEFEALAMVLELGEKVGADCAMANDPDSDRLALVVRDAAAARGPFQSQSRGDLVFLNGNQTGALLIDHVLGSLRARGRLRPEHKVVKTIVTSELHRHVCDAYGVGIFDTLTGFKWIAGLVRSWEEKGLADHRFIFGTEESFGFMPGDYVRDKDGIGALCQAVEMVAALKTQGKTCVDRLLELFSAHGAWQEDLINIDLVGEEGARRIGRIMESFRSHPPVALAASPVARIRDYKRGQVMCASTALEAAGATRPASSSNVHDANRFVLDPSETIALPVSDVLQFQLADGGRISMRPSGTEPKLKFYVSVRTECQGALTSPIAAFDESCRRIAALREELTGLISAIP